MLRYALVALPLWGHCRPELTLAVRLIKLHPHLFITLFLATKTERRHAVELAKARLTDDESSRLEVVLYPSESKTSGKISVPPPADDGSLPRFYRVIGRSAFERYKAWLEMSRPSALLLDAAVYRGAVDTFIELHNARGGSIPKLGAVYPLSLPWVQCTSMGPMPAAISAYNDKLAADPSADAAAIFRQCFQNSHDKFPETLGIDMYLWESDPLETSRMHKHMRRLDTAPDFSVVIWPSSTALRGARSHSTSLSNFLIVGPQVLDDPEPDVAQKTDPIIEYLDTKPAESVLYIGFGSIFYPPTAHQARLLLAAIRRAGLGIVMVQTPAMDHESVQLVKEFCKSGRGLLVPWLDQPRVLQHKAVVGFLSHGGANGAMEAMLAQVPMILWPEAGDQPFIANELSLAGNAIELVQVRRGHNLGKTTAKGVKILGTDNAISEEIDAALAALTSGALRDAANAVGQRVKEDMISGDAYRAMLALGRLDV